MRTWAAEMLGVKLPIYTFSHCRDAVASVSSTVGFDIVGTVVHSPMRLEIEPAMVSEFTDAVGRPAEWLDR